ncbi:MAG TPA: hypothetical protein DCL15_23580 [Chloroflexi bacterium]|nr:hypothetical protein [Chloroflexota bacterium]HHW85228.1 DUF1653 domain-containing protein [Chloroflexota bacterium]
MVAIARRLPPGRYRHFKGREYEVIGVAVHSESEEALVVYRPLYGSYQLMVRPAAMFLEVVTRDGVHTPRFTYLGPTTMNKLAPPQWRAARHYLLHHARPLEAVRYRYHFEGGKAGAVLAALATFRNDDGGFGKALEPDLRTSASSVLATSVAFQVLEEVDAPAEHPLVQGGLAYLLASYDSTTQRWPIIPPEAEAAPRAFWWAADGLEARFGHFALNPRAEVLGIFWRYADPSRIPWLEHVTARVVEQIEQAVVPLVGNDLLCVLRLAATPQMPAAWRARLDARLRQALTTAVAATPDRWGDYGLRPLEVAPTPAAPYAPLFAEAIQANLDYLIDTQRPDGAWSPTWSWRSLDPSAWVRAEREWQGVLTLAALRALDAWGRVAR